MCPGRSASASVDDIALTLDIAAERRKEALAAKIARANQLGAARVEASKTRLSESEVAVALDALRSAMGLEAAAQRREQQLAAAKEKAAKLAQPRLGQGGHSLVFSGELWWLCLSMCVVSLECRVQGAVP